MNDVEKKLIQCSREIRESYVLKKEERIRISENVLNHAHQNDHKAKIPSPYHKVKFPHFFFMNYSSIALLCIFIFTGVLSYVAENALPGDPLYNVKTNFNENLQSILTVSPESNAKFQTTLVKKRLQEAEDLAAADKLSGDNEKTLAINFEKNFEDFKQSIQEVDNSQSSIALLKISATTSKMAVTASTTEEFLTYDAKTIGFEAAKKLSYAALHAISQSLEDVDVDSVFSSSSTAKILKYSTSSMPAEFSISLATTSDIIASSSIVVASTSLKAISHSFAFEMYIIDMQIQANDAIALLRKGEYAAAFENFQEVLVKIDFIKEKLALTQVLNIDSELSPETATSTATTTLSTNVTSS